MFLWKNRFNQVMAPEGDGGGGGGGGNPPPPTPPAPDNTDWKAKYEEAQAALAAKNNPPAPKPDDDLAEKARRAREAQDKSGQNEKALEAALRFNMESKDWVKTNASLLPKTIEGIFTQAEKENYGSAIEKDGAIKAGIMSEFFAVQANLDLLTPGLKSQLEDFNKLTKNVKQERAQGLWSSVFEPAFAQLKSVEKAKQLSKGLANPSDAEAAHTEKMKAFSKKYYLGEK